MGYIKTEMKKALVSAAILVSTTASATIMEQTFTMTGDHGESGTGHFTWDNSVVPDGTPLNDSSSSISPNVLSIDITISGGNIAGGTTHFTKADCSGAYLYVTPDFTNDINFWCDNGSNTLYGVEVYTNELNLGVSTLTFAPGTTAPAVAVPLFGPLGSALLAGIFGFFGLRKIKRA